MKTFWSISRERLLKTARHHPRSHPKAKAAVQDFLPVILNPARPFPSSLLKNLTLCFPSTPSCPLRFFVAFSSSLIQSSVELYCRICCAFQRFYFQQMSCSSLVKSLTILTHRINQRVPKKIF